MREVPEEEGLHGNPRMSHPIRGWTTALLLTALAVVGCNEGPEKVTVYSGRNEKLIGPLLDRFADRSGIKIEVRYADTSQLTATLMEEGDRTPADVFIGQDAAALGALSDAGLLREIANATAERVPERFRSPRNDWVGLSGRARVVVYNTELIQPEELPQSLSDVAAPHYRGRFGVAPNNASFQAHMATYLALNGEDALRDLLAGIAGNEPRIYPKNSPIVEAVIAGEIDWGLVNHYYLMRALAENPQATAKNFVMNEPDGSGFVNVTAVGLLHETPAALRLVQFLISDEAQRYFAEQTFEYPLIEGMLPVAKLPAENFRANQIDYGEISRSLEPALELIQESGLTRFQ